MTGALSQADEWVKVALAVLAGCGAFLYTTTGFMKEFWAYKARIREMEPIRADTARAMPGAAIADSLALADLTSAVKDLTAAIRDDTTSDERRGNDRLTTAIEGMMAIVDRERREEHGKGRR